MIDVSPKFNTLRYAQAEGYLYGSKKILKRVFDKTVPKGDVAQVARAAGINAAKRCADWITFCHPIPLDWVDVRLEPDEYYRVRSPEECPEPYLMLSVSGQMTRHRAAQIRADVKNIVVTLIPVFDLYRGVPDAPFTLSTEQVAP